MKQTRLPFRNLRDATSHITLEILPKDIAAAHIKDPSGCVMAKACKRQLGREARIHLTRVYIKKNGGDTWIRYLVPSSLRGEIISFDRGGKFFPGRYVLSPPYKTAKLGADKRRGRTNPKKDGKPTYKVTKDVRTGPASGV